MNNSVAQPAMASPAVERVPVTRMQRLVAEHLSKSWASIPHVFHQDEADVSAAQAACAALRAQSGRRITLLACYVKALQEALQAFPTFNASLSPGGDELLLKKDLHVGFAVDAPRGLVVPVIRHVDRLGLVEIAAAIEDLSSRARGAGLPRKDMGDAGMSISSLGAAGGTGFTPIINAPEVAILGLSRILERPVRGVDGALAWRPTQPLSLSYDHRVINGAQASQFMRFIVHRIESEWSAALGADHG